MGHPLVFLTVRSTYNGVRRALTSGRRLVALIFFVGYYLLFFIRPFQPARTSYPRSQPLLNLPPMASIHAVVFLGLALLSLFLAAGCMNFRGSFRPADVDVLFPTPISPRLVLLFRMARDYLLTLFLPLFIAVVSFRSTSTGVHFLFHNFPRLGGYALRAGTAAWLLIAMSWVCIGYALSLFVNRTDLESDRNRKWIGWSVFLALSAAAIYGAVAVRRDPSWDTIVAVTENPFVRMVFFTASAGAEIVMAPITGNLWSALVGLAALLAIIFGSLKLAFAQVGWMYDQAAARGFDAIDLAKLRRRGDTYAILADQASKGKLRANRFSARISDITVTGAKALLWKEAVLFIRGSVWQGALFVPLAVISVGVPMYALQDVPSNEAGITCLGLMGFLVFSIAMSGQSGFIELLRRVDIQRPLPFSASTIVFWEVVSKVVPVAGSILPAGLVALCLRPSIWTYAVSGMIGAPFLALEIISTVLVVTLAFPDIEDPSQRGFRQMMILLAVFIASLPGLGIFAALILTRISWIVLVVVFSLINLAVSAAISAFGGSLYAAYNPSE
jgi:hypothetical protein